MSFMDHTFGVVPKKSSSNSRDFSFSHMLSSRSFIVLHITFRSLVYFELIFVKSISLIFLNVDVYLFQYHLLKRLSLLYVIALLLFKYQMIKFMWAYLFVLWQFQTSLIITALWKVLKFGSISSPTLFFSFHIGLAILGLLPFHLRVSLLICTK